MPLLLSLNCIIGTCYYKQETFSYNSLLPSYLLPVNFHGEGGKQVRVNYNLPVSYGCEQA